MEILRFGNKALRKQCKLVQRFDRELHEKIEAMAATLFQHRGGAALAAPQVGLQEQIVVVNYMGQQYELLNPEILYESGSVTDYEGCLSLPGFFGKVERSRTLSLQYRNRFGEKEFIEVKDEMARCFLHEIDHLYGILFVDRVLEDLLFNEMTGKKVPLRELLNLVKEKRRPLKR